MIEKYLCRGSFLYNYYKFVKHGIDRKTEHNRLKASFEYHMVKI